MTDKTKPDIAGTDQPRPTPSKSPVPDTTPAQQATRPSASEPKPNPPKEK